MPKLTHKLPSYRHHKKSGQAVVTLNGTDHYLGTYQSEESHRGYKRLIGKWLAGGGRLDDLGVYHIVELTVAYIEYAEAYYVKDGRSTGEVSNLKESIRPLLKLYQELPVSEFGPRCLKAVRQEMVESNLCRRTVNARVNRIRRMFKWGVEEELVPANVLHALQAVAPLKYGRSSARESEPVKPVPDHFVDAVEDHVARPVWAMIELQRLTGMRSGEVTSMRPCDLNTTGKLWIYTPKTHKTQHHGHTRTIHLGPRAQAIIEPFLNRPLDAYLFNPAEAMKEHRRRRHRSRVTPMSCGNRPGSKKPKKNPKSTPMDQYTPGSYLRAVYYGCEKAFPHPELSKIPARRLTEKQKEKLKQWKREHRWHPHQLRHNAATNLRKSFGIEAARVILGHKTAGVTEIYAEIDEAKAAEIMSKVG